MPSDDNKSQVRNSDVKKRWSNVVFGVYSLCVRMFVENRMMDEACIPARDCKGCCISFSSLLHVLYRIGGSLRHEDVNNGSVFHGHHRRSTKMNIFDWLEAFFAFKELTVLYQYLGIVRINFKYVTDVLQTFLPFSNLQNFQPQTNNNSQNL